MRSFEDLNIALLLLGAGGPVDSRINQLAKDIYNKALDDAARELYPDEFELCPPSQGERSRVKQLRKLKK
tara:strand:+ start:482 stop:691 length:210 start_codon:yes stop_codon:yes gene_type:complete